MLTHSDTHMQIKNLFKIKKIYFFSIALILTSLLWTFLPRVAKASVDGLGITFDANYSSPAIGATLFNDPGSPYPNGQVILAEYAEYHCNNASGDACVPGVGDFDQALIPVRNVGVTPMGASSRVFYDTVPFSCGRVQMDVGLPNGGGLLGGKVYSSGQNCVAPTPTPTATPQPTAPATAGPTATPQVEMAFTCKGWKTRAQMQSELRGAGYPGPWNIDDEIIGYNNAACPSATPTPIPTAPATAGPTAVPTVIPTAVPTIANQVSCPSGYVQSLSGSTIVCVQQVQTQTQTQYANAYTAPVTVNLAGQPVAQTPQIVYYQQQPQVIQAAYDVKTLPKTGLPVLAWGLSGLLPIGLGFRKFGSTDKSLTSAGKYLWEKREFLKS
ncbi:MAG: hypothetical protein Q7R97_03925 [Candidatus Daviesbacteria bacterium]|nr:hypothetical protein [Candidatus Daviesbacteria bacterium]